MIDMGLRFGVVNITEGSMMAWTGARVPIFEVIRRVSCAFENPILLLKFIDSILQTFDFRLLAVRVH